MAWKYENYDGGAPAADWTAVGWVSTGAAGELTAQTFTPTVTHTVSSAKLYIKKIDADPITQWAVGIANVNESGTPQWGSYLASLVENPADGAFGEQWVEFVFSGTAVLEAGTTYALVFSLLMNGALPSVYWAKKTPDTVYTGGQIWHWAWNGIPWPGLVYAGTGEGDQYFEEWGEGSQPPPDDLPSFPVPRPDDYDPDLPWLPGEWTGDVYTPPDWGTSSDYAAAGGGRWGQQLVVAGDNSIYYEEVL